MRKRSTCARAATPCTARLSPATNRAGDDRSTVGLEQAIASIIAFLEDNDLRDVRLVAHSYSGMVISGVADRVPERLRRIVYVNAFVPLDGECLNDMIPGYYVELFDSLAAANDNAVMLPFAIWREAFINDADLPLAQSAYAKLNPDCGSRTRSGSRGRCSPRDATELTGPLGAMMCELLRGPGCAAAQTPPGLRAGRASRVAAADLAALEEA